MNTIAKVVEKPLHPLATSLQLEYSWSDWKKDWEAEKRHLYRRNLLHIGWGARTADDGEWAERVVFYIELADRYDEIGAFRGPEERTGFHEEYIAKQCKARMDLAQKAFQVLCEEFFRDKKEKYESISSWMRYFQYEAITRKVMWFLRSGNDFLYHNWSLTNLRGRLEDDNHIRATFRKFATDFAKWTWGFQGFRQTSSGWFRSDDEESQNFRKLMEEMEPERVELVYGLGLANIFLDAEKYPLTARGMAKLRKIAFSRKHKFPGEEKERTPKNIREAVFAGVFAARIVHLLEVSAEEAKHFAEIAEARRVEEGAKRKAEEAKRKVESLSNG